MTTEAEYLQLLSGFEQQLRRHSDPWNHIMDGPLARELRRAWESTALAFKEDHPEAVIPTPFWLRTQSEDAAAEGVPSGPS